MVQSRADGMSPASACASARRWARSWSWPMTRVGTAIARISASLTPGPSPAIATSNLPNRYRVRAAKKPCRLPRLSGASLAARRLSHSHRTYAWRLQANGASADRRPRHRAAYWPARLRTPRPAAPAPAPHQLRPVTASRSAIAAPIEMPPTTAGAEPRSSISAATSSAKVAIERSLAGPVPDPPWPRHSSVTRRVGRQHRETPRPPARRRRRARAGRRRAGPAPTSPIARSTPSRPKVVLTRCARLRQCAAQERADPRRLGRGRGRA